MKTVLTPAQERRIVDLRAAGYSYAAISDATGVAHGTIERCLGRMARSRDLPPGVNMPTPLTITGDAVIVGDVHVPATDWDFAHLPARVAEKRGITTLIVAGDFFNMDAFSPFSKTSKSTAWEQERDYGRRLLSDWLETFQHIYICMGNHEARLIKFVQGEFGADDIFGLLTTSEKITTTNYSWAELISGGIRWRVTHPRNYGINQLTTAAELAQKYDCNVVTLHEHHLGLGYDRWKRHLAVNGGTLVDDTRLEYVQMTDSKSAGMARGFVAIKNGCPHLYGRHPFTDWDYELS